MKKIVLAGLLAAGMGCARPTPKLEGTWTIVHSGAEASRIVSHETTFHPGGRYEGVAKSTTPNGAVMVQTDTGVWSLADGDKLTVRIDDLAWTFEGADAANTRHWLDQLEPREKTQIRTMNNLFPITIAWKGEDEFSAIVEGKPVTSRRKK